MINILLVFLGGGAGSVVRFLLGSLFRHSGLQLPMATLVSNLSASLLFALGILLIKNKPGLNSEVGLFALVGFCGGLSTFSTFGYETFQLLKAGMINIAALNIVLSCALSIALFYLVLK